MNKSLKEIHENTSKEVEALKEEANKNKIQESTIKQVKDMNKTVQVLKREIEAIKKTQTEAILEMENLGKRTGTIQIQHNTNDGKENHGCRRYDTRE